MVDKYNYGVVDTAECRVASEALSSAFSWVNTPEGMNFWSAINTRLERLAAGHKPQGKCLAEDNYGLSFMTKEVERLREQVSLLDIEIHSQAQQIAELTRKLRVADWVNSSTPRG